MTTKTASLPYLDTMATIQPDTNQQKSPKFRAIWGEKGAFFGGIKMIDKKPPAMV